jgi:hypothetical protein
MKKTLSMYPVPEWKNNFKNWVDIIRSRDPISLPEHDLSLRKSIYIRRSGKSLSKNANKWNDIQSKSRDKYLEKIKLMEEIRQRKLENKTYNFIYTPRYAYPKVSAGK